VAAQGIPTHRTPPLIYRVARALRWTGTIVLVLLVVFAGTVAYSAYETAHATIRSESFSGVFVSNGVIEVSGSFVLSNPGIYPIESLELAAHVANASGVHLATLAIGPKTIEGGSTGVFPISLGLPIDASSAVESLLFEDQPIELSAWANVTYAYLFPLSIALLETRSWGAPFEGFAATVGTPTYNNNEVTAPVTLSWANHADFDEQGSISFTVESAGQVTCGGGSFPVDVPSGQLFDQTDVISMSTTCSPSGGELLLTYSVAGTSTTFPPEPIP